jgi:hypothetical protein
MPVNYIHSDYVSGFYEWGGSSPSTWSIDVNFPAQSVYASASISYLTDETVFCGIQFYYVLEPIGGGNEIPMLRFPTPTNNGVAPSIKDDKVFAVSFGCF